MCAAGSRGCQFPFSAGVLLGKVETAVGMGSAERVSPQKAGRTAGPGSAEGGRMTPGVVLRLVGRLAQHPAT